MGLKTKEKAFKVFYSGGDAQAAIEQWGIKKSSAYNYYAECDPSFIRWWARRCFGHILVEQSSTGHPNSLSSSVFEKKESEES